MNKKVIRFGVIGAGAIAAFHANAIQSLENSELIGFFDVNAESAAKRAEEFKVKAYGSLEEMLADGQIDAVTIATPSGMHGEAAIAAANAGKHVICEKPLEITLPKIDAMISTCEKNNVLLASIFQSRLSETIQTIRNTMLKGRFGKMVLASAQMRWYRDQEYYNNSNWRGTWSMDGGGALMNQAIHLIDQLIYINGEPAEVCAFSGALTHDIEVEDTLCAAVRYRNGSFGTIEVSTSCAPGFSRRLDFSGSGGTISCEDDKLTRWEFVEADEEDEKMRSMLAREVKSTTGSGPNNFSFAGHAAQIGDFADAIINGGKPAIDGRDGRKAVELICGIYESVRTGKPYKFN